jgi:glycosyltransferase involved in cell wall biosynthesis
MSFLNFLYLRIRFIFRVGKSYVYFLKSKSLTDKSNSQSAVTYIVEPRQWSIYWDGKQTADVINQSFGKNFLGISENVFGLKGQIVHFGSQFMWQDFHKITENRFRTVVSYFHGKPGDGKAINDNFLAVLKYQKKIDRLIVPNSIVKKRIVSYGFNENKVILVPIAVDMKVFKPKPEEFKEEIRSRLGFKPNQIVIGSFQKDGVGWQNGDLPKLIKGPDIFLDVISELRKNIEVTVLLTGPSRGYVKSGLEKARIPFQHIEIQDYISVANYYQALDVYLVTSREEGGPKGLLESMASGISVVSTPVGMAVDLIEDMKSGGKAIDFNPKTISMKVLEIINSPERNKIINSALARISECDTRVVANKILKEVYLPLLASN